jgi:hypothetical protein
MNLDEPVWDVTVFTKNRNRLLEGEVAREFLGEVVKQAGRAAILRGAQAPQVRHQPTG